MKADAVDYKKGLIPIQLFRAQVRRSKRVWCENNQKADVVSLIRHAPLIHMHVDDKHLDMLSTLDEQTVASVLLEASWITVESIMVEIDNAQGVFLVHQRTPTIAKTWFLYAEAGWDGIKGDGLDKRHFDWNQLFFIDDDTGLPPKDRVDRDMIRAILFFSLGLISMAVPNKRTIQTYPAGSTTLRSKRTPIESMTSVWVEANPDTLPAKLKFAKSNWRNAMSGRKVLPRETITLENGEKKPGYIARCDEPGCEVTQEITASNQTGSLPQVVISRKLKQAGWKVNGRCLCPDHANPKPKEPPVEKVTVLPPREMAPADRRRIFREIDEAWDEAKGRYGGMWTDNQIAVKLNVPRAWVVAIREESFGKSQRNGEIEKLAGDIKDFEKRCTKAIEDALDAASKLETFLQEIAVLKARVEAVE